MILKKNNLICAWGKNESFISYYPKEFTIKKGKDKLIRFVCHLEDLIYEPSNNLEGSYIIQIELANMETKKNPKQTVKSNVVEFEITK